MGCKWWRRVIWESDCRWLDALQSLFAGCHGLRVVALCYWGMQLQIATSLVSLVLRSVASGGAVFLGGVQLQIARHLLTVGSRW